MKRCSQCNRTYTDETLNFCLDDGTALVSTKDALTDENIARPTEERTEILSHEQLIIPSTPQAKTSDQSFDQETIVNPQSSPANFSQPQTVQKGVSPMFAYLSIGLLALLVLLVGGGLVALITSNSATSPNENTELAKNISNANESNTNENDEENIDSSTLLEPSKTSPKKQEDKKETPKPSDKPNTDQTPASTQTPSPTDTPKPDDGKYFVILGSFPQSQSAQAQQRLQNARNKGLSARIVNTSNHPGLRSGLIAVVMGPYSKAAAQSALGKARSVSSDAYVKAGK